MSVKDIREKFLAFRNKSLVKDSIWLFLGKGASFFIKAAYFIIIARYLGPKDYGAFVSISALTDIIFPFVGFGCTHILIRNAARDRRLFRFAFGNALFLVFASSFTIILLAVFIVPRFLIRDVSWILVFFIFVADLIGVKLLGLSASAFIATNSAKNSAQVDVVYSFSKLLAAIGLMVFLPNAGAVTWSFLYCLSTLVVAIPSVFLVARLIDLPKVKFDDMPALIKDGLYFSLSESADGINSNVDRAMLANMKTLEATGVYGAAFRFVHFLLFPIMAVLGSSYPRFFQHGVSGIKGSLAFAKRLLPAFVLYGLFAALALVLFAPTLPLLLGEEYREAIPALYWLSSVPLLLGIQKLVGDTLTGAGFQSSRSAVIVASTFLNIGLNLWLIPTYSWQGAIWATLASEVFKIVTFSTVIGYLYAQASRSRNS